MSIENEIKEAIRKNLPTEVGEALRERLEQAEELEQKNHTLTKDLEKRDSTIISQNNTIKELHELLVKAGNINEKEKSVTERENKLEIALLGIQLSETRRSKDDIFRLVHSLTKNVEYKESMIKNMASERTGERDQYGNDIYRNYDTGHETTKSIE